MLDLNKLALRLEEALENETTESLNAWLVTQTTDIIDNYVGEGEVICLPDYTEVISIETTSVKFICDTDSGYDNVDNNNYGMAA